MGEGESISFLLGTLPCLALAQNADLKWGLYYQPEREKFLIPFDLWYGVLLFYGLDKDQKDLCKLDFICAASLPAEVELTCFDIGWAAIHSAEQVFNPHFDTSSSYLKMPAFAPDFCHCCMLGTQILPEHFSEIKESPWKLELLQTGCDSVMKNKKIIELSRKRLTATGLQTSQSSSGAKEILGASQLVRSRGHWKSLPLQRWFQFFQRWQWLKKGWVRQYMGAAFLMKYPGFS